MRRGMVDLSLGATLAKQSTATVQKVEEVQQQRNKEASEAEVSRLWYRFPSMINDMTSIHFVFTKAPDWQEDSNTIHITLPNTLVADEVNGILPKLLKYMRDGLENDFIQIDTQVVKTQRSNIDMSPKGKARAMAEKNDKLRDLCRRLHLDFA